MVLSIKYHQTALSGAYVADTCKLRGLCAYITLVNTELGFRLFKLGISTLVGFYGALPYFDSIRRCAPLIRFCDPLHHKQLCICSLKVIKNRT